MSNTPRTKAAIQIFGDYIRSEPAVSVDFAEELEGELIRVIFELSDAKTELAEARAEIERKDKLIEQMRELLQLKNAILGHCRFVTYPPKKIIEKLEKIEAALAAERGERV